MKRLVTPTRHRLALPFAAALLSMLLLLALTSPPVLGATYLAALQRAVVHGRSAITLPVWTTAQAAGLDTLCRWYEQTLGLDIRMAEPSEGTAIALPLRTVRLPDPSAQGALRLQATGEAELVAALGLLQRFTASEAYILYHPLAANSASLETPSDDDARAATSQPIPDASALAERLAPLLQAFAEGAANAFEQPLQSLSWRLVPALQLVPAPRSDIPDAEGSAPARLDTPDAEGSAPARSTHTLMVAGNSTKAVWLHLNYQFAPLSEAGQLQVFDARAIQTGDPQAESIGLTLSGDCSSAAGPSLLAGSSLLAGQTLPRSSSLPGSPSQPRSVSRLASLVLRRNPSASACFPEDVRRRMPMFRQADGPMVPARRTLEACGALVAYDSRTREVHWLINGVRHSVRMNQAFLLRGHTFCQLPAPIRLQDGSLWMPIEALPGYGN